VTTAAIRRAKLHRRQQQTNTQIFKGRMPFLSPNQQCQSTEGKCIPIMSHFKMLDKGQFNFSKL